MKIIKLTARENGSRPPIQTWNGKTPPAGYAELPEALDLSAWETHRGFVALTVDGDTVTAMTGNQAALDAYLAALPEPGEAVPTSAQRIATLEEENKLLKAQVSAQSAQLDFYEDCIAEMAAVVYA